MSRIPVSFTAPSAWASYLINGDDSDMEASEKALADQFVAWVCAGPPVSCEDAGFIWHHNAEQFCPLGADCQTYTFLKEE